MKINRYLDLLLEMTKKEIKARYKNAVLGFLWIFLNPLLQMIIIGFIFQYFIKVPIKSYYIFLFPGLLAWNFFSYSLTKTTPSIVYERDLIQKAKFPREFIPISIVLANYLNFLISLCLFIIFLFIKGNLSPLLSFDAVLLLLFVLLWLLFFTCGLSLLTSTLNVRYRDVNFFIQALVILWFYATPIMYSLENLPPRFIFLFRLNPLTYPFEILRFSLLGSIHLPNEIFFINFIISIFLTIAGCLIFKKESKYFSDWL